MNTPVVHDARVFVVMDDGKKDLSPALCYGDPVVLFKNSFYPDTANERQNKVLKHALRVLADFDEGNDSVLLVGDTVLIAVAFAALTMLGFTKVRMLKYDRRTLKYYPIEMDFSITLGVV